MKKIILTSVLALLTLWVSSQAFIRENKSWNVVECMNWGGCETITFKVTGDTTVAQVEYKKVYSTRDTTLNSWLEYGAIRENESKVYFYLFENETEVLLYDFDLNLGDSFVSTHNSLEYQDCPIEMQVSSIDTVTTVNGEQRQRFTFSNGEIWISGIGSLYGLVYVGVYECVADMFYDLSCCHEDNELLFQSADFDKCFINTVGIEEMNTPSRHTLYPNPISQSTVLRFDYPASLSYQLQIYNSTGQAVQEIENIKSGEVSIPANQLNPGIYFYLLTDGKDKIAAGKFVKK